jgi:hypothetical protein
MNNLLSPAMNRHLKGLLLLVLLFGAEFVKNCEHGGWALFELVSGDSKSLSADPGEECESETDTASFPDTTGDDDGGFQSPFHADFTGNPACPFFHSFSSLQFLRQSRAANTACRRGRRYRSLSSTVPSVARSRPDFSRVFFSFMVTAWHCLCRCTSFICIHLPV